MKRNLIPAMLSVMPAILAAQTTKPPAFEVAEIKPSDPSITKMGKGRMLPGGRIELSGYTLRELIIVSYGVTDDMISGGAKWVGEERYSIVAKAPPDARENDLLAMVKTLLTDRFALATHREDRVMPAYVLTLAKNAAPLHEGSAGGASQCQWSELEGGLNRRECNNLPMAEFAKQLPLTGRIGIALPVLDQTGLKGSYDFQFDVGTIRQNPDRPADSAPDPLDTDGPTIFEALQKIGLHLESKKIPVSTIVIDKAERPSSN